MGSPSEPATTGPSIVTLTMNPALDITTETEFVLHTEKMRCDSPRYDPGAHSVHVIVALIVGDHRQLGPHATTNVS